MVRKPMAKAAPETELDSIRAEIRDLRQSLDRCHRDLDSQFKRISMLQAELEGVMERLRRQQPRPA